MHNNYYFLKHLSVELEIKLKGFSLLEVFSQNKDELILGFASSNESYYIKAHLQSDFCCLYFTEDFQRSKKNSINLFPLVIGKKVIGIRQFLNERCFSIQLEDNLQLLFKMHGNRSNIILYSSQKVKALFKNSLKNDARLDITQMDRHIDQSYRTFELAEFDYRVLFPTFGKQVKRHLEENNFKSISSNDKWNLLQNVLQKLQKRTFHIVKTDNQYELYMLNSKSPEHTTNSAIEAVNYFYLNHIKSSQLNKEKKQAISLLEKKISQSKNYISKVTDKLNSIKNSTNYEIVANIIMANLHTIDLHLKEVKLNNFYDNSEITIKLNPKLSPQKNAENYYRKSKNQKIEIDKLQETLNSKKNIIQLISSQLDAITSIDSTSELRKYLKDNSINPITRANKTVTLPYHDLSFEGYSIWIGKNAKNNDVVTQKLAWKEDLWLHAKDVSGSHVIIKYKSGQVIPKHVIEKAAQWAAFYSKRKNESLCPVIVTPKKFVRKPKGLPPGAVVVDKETVVLVSPEKPITL